MEVLLNFRLCLERERRVGLSNEALGHVFTVWLWGGPTCLEREAIGSAPVLGKEAL